MRYKIHWPGQIYISFLCPPKTNLNSATIDAKTMSLQTLSPSCSCNTDLPLSLKHILYHQTTRTPLFVHPSCWSGAHLRFLRIVVKSLPPYPPPPPPPYAYPDSYLSIQPTSQVTAIQSGIGHGPQYSHSVQAIVCATISIADDFGNPIHQEFPIFQQVPALLFPPLARFHPSPKEPVANFKLNRYFRHPFPLKVGPTTTYVTPGMYVEHAGQHKISIPFLAYNDPYHREVEQFQNSWSPCIKERVQYSSSENNVTVDPFDVSILLAMAQVQEMMLPPQEVYKVCTFLSLIFRPFP